MAIIGMFFQVPSLSFLFQVDLLMVPFFFCTCSESIFKILDTETHKDCKDFASRVAPGRLWLKMVLICFF